MKVVVATDARLHRCPDGTLRSPSEGRAYPFWARYLSAFDSVQVIARVTGATAETGSEVEGDGVSVYPLPDFYGGIGYLRERNSLRASLDAVSKSIEPTAYIARVPGLVGGLLTSMLTRRRLPHALEVVGDPAAAMQSISLSMPVKWLLGMAGGMQLRRQCSRADAVSYVTGYTLQRLYPPGPTAATASYSSVELPDSAFAQRDTQRALAYPPTAIVVATMSQPYKGHDVMLEALSLLRIRGVEVRTRFIGSGRYQRDLEALASQLGVRSYVDFAGQLGNAHDVRMELDRADLFVLPSRTEGLPRALIEAMARGLPCIASRVGGIPELLEDTEVVPPGDPEALAEKMLATLGDSKGRAETSRRNFRIARQFHRDRLDEKRKAFYVTLRELSSNPITALESNGEKTFE